VAIRPLADLEKAAGRVTRLKSEALDACGGKKCHWALAHEEVIRHLMNQVFDEIRAWQIDAEKYL
jgi:hypothetical protein